MFKDFELVPNSIVISLYDLHELDKHSHRLIYFFI